MSIPELLNYLNYLIGFAFLVFILINIYIVYRTRYYTPREKKRWILMFVTILILSFFTKGNNLFSDIFEFLDLFGLMFILPILFSVKAVSILYHSSDDFNLNENVEKQRARKKDLFSVYLFILMLFFVPTYSSGGSVTAGNCIHSYQIRCSGLSLPGTFGSPLCIGFIVSGSYGESKNCDTMIPELIPIPTILNESIKPGATSEDKNPDNTVIDSSNWQTYENNRYGMSFNFPDNYFVGINDYGLVNHAEATDFFFRRKSDDYNGVPVLGISSSLELSPGQTLENLVQIIYDINQKSGYTNTSLEAIDFAGLRAYRFGLESSYVDTNGSQLMDSSGSSVLFLQKDNRVFKFLQTGSDDGLVAILNSLKFK